ncbi:nuclear transport factor 2 family protein [Rheinheimera sp. 1928-s]|uniref:nuclear transport factor 2 family protein n=1 Tax=Rheinheimera sp. 1928-s TaxID=3033803 RepID=UPI0026215B7E|nr:nuclear transport factor 2 family protein [Rheinheimera sp. 1928-s]MDF3123452.1 nuclear transport factor 2 family protein [Rheinheimera sp. 1928-s]
MRHLFTPIFALIVVIFMHQQSWASDITSQNQPDVAAIQQVLKNYIEGTSYSNRPQIAKAFHPAADLLLDKEGQAFNKVPVTDYLGMFNSAYQGKFNGRVGEILQIDVSGNLATAKVEILIPSQQARFIDVFLLKQIDNQWQIITKAATKQASSQNGVRVLFILSSAHFHGNSKIPAGASFPEIVNAYHSFKQAGYTVEFVSPEGGAVPLAYIDTSKPLFKEHLYDSDLMFALGHTKKATQLQAKDYRAVHYVGGSSAMYGVADNAEISKLVMDIYEEHNGIISAVCHGTAGIVHLKTKDGKYLVDGKRISGSPEDYEIKSADYFKQFPFLIKQTVLDRNGTFHFGKRDEAYIEVDGRIVTGQNHQSSALVAEAIIKQLQAEQASVK